MDPLLRNPVYHSLQYNDGHLGSGAGSVRWFHPAVSPFAGFEEGDDTGLRQLYQHLPADRGILVATPQPLHVSGGWTLVQETVGRQFLLEGAVEEPPGFSPVALGPADVPAMLQLAELTKPGPFGPRTIEFGHYFGVFDDGRLVAMSGQRLHVKAFTEISAVCTHPDYLGKGYATALVQHGAALIRRSGATPFLHVRADNLRAIAVYKRLGFVEQGPMYFNWLTK